MDDLHDISVEIGKVFVCRDIVKARVRVSWYAWDINYETKPNDPLEEVHSFDFQFLPGMRKSAAKVRVLEILSAISIQGPVIFSVNAESLWTQATRFRDRRICLWRPGCPGTL